MCLAGNHVKLLLTRQLDEANRIAGHADSEVLVFFLLRVFHRVLQLLDAEHVHVQVVASGTEVPVQDLHELFGTFRVVVPEGRRVDGLRDADAIERVVVRDLCCGIERSQEAVLFGTVARVCARRKRFTRLAPIGERSRRLAIDNVARNRENTGCRFGVAVGRVVLNLRHERLQEPHGNVVGAVVVVSVTREVAFNLEVLRKAGFLVADDLHLRVLHGAEAVDHVAEACDAGRERAAHVGIDERHLGGLVVVLVVHVVNQVQRVHVQACKPVEVQVELVHQLVVVQVLARDGRVLGANLLALANRLVLTAVDGVQERLREVRTCTEELHLLAGLRCRNTAADAVVVTPDGAHRVVVLVLDGACLHGDFCGELLEVLGQARAVEHGEVRLGRGAHVHERVQEAVVRLGDHVAAVLAEARNFERGPHRVAAEQFVVARDARELDHAELHHEVVHEFLGFLFGEDSLLHVAVDVDVEERGYATHAHCRTVLRLDGGEVAEVQPLHGLACVPCGLRNVVAVNLRHFLHALERLDLFGEFLALAHDFFGHVGLVGEGLVGHLLLDEVVNTVEGHAAVVAHDSTAAVGVGEARDDVGLTGCAHCRGVRVEHALVVRLVVVRENVVQFCARGVAVVLAGFLGHLDAAERHERALQGLVRLEAHNLFQILRAFADVAGGVARERRYHVGIHVEHAALRDFLLLQFLDLVPELGGGGGRAHEERLVPVVGLVVLLDEHADVDFFFPALADESVPFFFHYHLLPSFILIQKAKIT